MDGKPVQRRRRRDRSIAEAKRLVAAYEVSGLSRQQFCEGHDVTLTTLSRYITRHRRQRAETSERSVTPELVAVEVAAPAKASSHSELTVVLSSGRRIEVRRDFDAETLQALVDVLERS